MSNFTQQVQPQIRAGDRWLFRWRCSDADAIKTHPENKFETHSGYEDQQDWVRELLKQGNEDAAIAFLASRFSGRVAAVAIGQEEDRSSGYPIRFVQIAMYLGSDRP